MTLYLIKLTSKTMHWNVYVRLRTKLSQRNFRKLTYGVTSVLLSFGIPTKVRNKLHHDKRKLRSGSVVSDHKITKIESVLTSLDFQISEGGQTSFPGSHLYACSSWSLEEIPWLRLIPCDTNISTGVKSTNNFC